MWAFLDALSSLIKRDVKGATWNVHVSGLLPVFSLIRDHVFSVLLSTIGRSFSKAHRSLVVAIVSRSWPGSDRPCINTLALWLYSFLLPVVWLWSFCLPFCSRSELMWVPHSNGHLYPLDHRGWISLLRSGLHFPSTLVLLDPQKDVSTT